MLALTKGSWPTVSLRINPANNPINSSSYTYDATGDVMVLAKSPHLQGWKQRIADFTLQCLRQPAGGKWHLAQMAGKLGGTAGITVGELCRSRNALRAHGRYLIF